MNSRERIKTALAHRMPDRVPLDVWIRPEVARKLAEHFKTTPEEAPFRLGKDVVQVYMKEEYPEFLARTNGAVPGDAPGAGKRFIFHDDGSYEDAWGIRWRTGRDGKYREWVTGPLAGDPPDLDAYKFPQPTPRETPEQFKKRVADAARQGAVMGEVDNPFKTAWALRGLENLLMDFVADPGFADALLARAYARSTERAKKFIAAGVDILMIVGDVAMQQRLMMSPDSWRALDKPKLAAMVAEIKRLRPDVAIYFHSDGNVEAIIPDLIEAGIEILNPVQPECMDPAKVKRLYGDKLTLWGTGSLQQTLPFGTEAEVRQEVRDTVRACAAGGGLVLMPSNVVGFDVPLKNLLAYYDEARSIDLSRL
jgi:uroporphyrinogen decarboxylase